MVKAVLTDKVLEVSNNSLIRNNIHCRPGYAKFKKLAIPNLTLTQTMLKRKIDNISQTKTKNDRIACIKPSSRHLRSGADVSLYINHTFFAFQAIRWRMNRICIGSICPSCDRKFYFNHADKCLGLTDTDDLFRFSTITALLRRLEAITAAIRPELLPP